MTRDPRPYNGLHLPGGSNGRLPTQEELQQLAFAQRQAIAREIFVRRAASMVDYSHPCSADDFRAVSEQCQIAAVSYFEGAKAHLEKQQRTAKQDDSAE